MATHPIPWARIFAEGAVIVVSILLALAADAWWSGRQERQQEAEYLSALRGELSNGRPGAQRLTLGLERTLHGHEALISQFREYTDPPEDSLLYWLAGLSFPASLNPPVAVLDELVSSGGIQLIRNDTLRLAIADYSRSLESYRLTADRAWLTWADRIQPFLEERVSRVDRLRGGPFPGAMPFEPSPFAANYRELFTERAFESMVAERWSRLERARAGIDDLEAMVTSLVERIDSELGTTEPAGRAP